MVIAPILGGHSIENTNLELNTINPESQINQQISVTMNVGENDETTLKVISSKVINGVASESTEIFKGTQDQMMSKLEELKIDGKILKASD